jgi:hypothetical protein
VSQINVSDLRFLRSVRWCGEVAVGETRGDGAVGGAEEEEEPGAHVEEDVWGSALPLYTTLHVLLEKIFWY